MNDEEKARSGDKSEGSSIAWVAIRELLSDILGAFLPGIYFTSVLMCYLILFFLMLDDKLQFCVLIDFIKPFMSFFVTIFFVFSYCIGSIFFRKDIKEPDKASAAQHYAKASETERECLAIDMSVEDKEKFKAYQERKFILWLKKQKLLKRLYIWLLEKKASEYLDVEYPYSHLYRYLEARNFLNLADIPWRDKIDARSKAFINICKVNIHKYLPKEMPEIVKNEAHARLMNSLWYTAKSINFISILFLILAFLGLIFFNSENSIALVFEMQLKLKFNVHFSLALIAVSITQLTLKWYFKHSIKQFLHYLRVREIVFVLQLREILKIMFKGKDEEKLIK